jgi:hypothetical protein
MGSVSQSLGREMKTASTSAPSLSHRRLVSAQRLVAGRDAFGQGVLVEVRAQARHSVGEVAYVYADGRTLRYQRATSSKRFGQITNTSTSRQALCRLPTFTCTRERAAARRSS